MPYVPSDKTPGMANDRAVMDEPVKLLAAAIATAAARHNYEGAFAGELNYSLTRLIQELPRELVGHGILKEELRYWIQPLIYGVLLDVALEHKLRVNSAYEAAQIIKSGDCYDTPYYTRLCEVCEADGTTVGHVHVMVPRSNETLDIDRLPRVLKLGVR